MATHEEQRMGQQGPGALLHEGDWLASRPRLVLVAVIAIFALLGVVVAVSGSSSGTTTPSPAAAAPTSNVPVSPTRMAAAALAPFASATLHQPVYWAGPRGSDVYEVQRTRDGSVYIRYLPAGTRLGDARPAFLLVATYPYPGALGRLKALADGAGTAVPGGGLALQVPGRATNFHLAFPGTPYEVEVYDPSPAVARHVAESGDIRPVG